MGMQPKQRGQCCRVPVTGACGCRYVHNVPAAFSGSRILPGVRTHALHPPAAKLSFSMRMRSCTRPAASSSALMAALHACTPACSSSQDLLCVLLLVPLLVCLWAGGC